MRRVARGTTGKVGGRVGGSSCAIRLIAPTILAVLVISPMLGAGAQGVTASGIRGIIRTADARPVEQARVRITHTATGVAVETSPRNGRFLVQGLEPGGPYTISVRSLGFLSQRREQIFLALGELRELEFLLEPLAAELATVTVSAGQRPSSPVHAHGGTATTITEPLLRSLPSLNRDLYDFVRLVPQISTKISLSNTAFSAAGAGFRFNNFLINGVSERTLAGGVSNAFSGAKSVPLDAVQEYQVLIAPYDVRYGDFAGALVNTITKSGTNAMHGSAFAYGRSDRLARVPESGIAASYDRLQYGFSLGGPLVRDRLQFFVASELQHYTFPATGPFVGQPEKADRPVPVGTADVVRFDDVMRRHGLVAGSPGAVKNGYPLKNVFSRGDLALPAWNSRAVLWHNYSDSDDLTLSRSALDTFSLSTYQVKRVAGARASALQLHTLLPRAGGGHNELLLAHRSNSLEPTAAVQQPIVRVSVPSVSGGRVTINSGTHETAQRNWQRSSATSLKDNLTLPLGVSHLLTLGVEAEHFRIRTGGTRGSYGTWTFANLDDLERGIADRYEVGIDSGSGNVPLNGGQYAAYVADQWRVGDRLSVTTGIRADMLALGGRPPYHTGVDSLFGRRTDQTPPRRIEISPRVGFIWDVSGGRQRHVRGGVGIFTGRFPLAWAHTALSSYGIGGGLLRCGRSPADMGLPPPFNPDYRAAPDACANGAGVATTRRGSVNLLDPDLRMMRTLRGSLAYDARVAGDVQFTGEILWSRALSDFVFVNLNLDEPEAADRNGRVMYGSIAPSGAAEPDRRSGFVEVIDLRNTSRNHSTQLVAKAEKRLTDRASAALSYTYSRVRDAQTPLRVGTSGVVAWASARAVSGRHDDFTAGISANDIPHRVVLIGTYAVRRVGWRTELSLYYVGESGRPFTYRAFGTLRRGDLNADGTNTNDPVYVPRSAFDTSEIRLDGDASSVAVQQAALENLIEQTSCLRRQRGRILQRNSCREPWSNTTIASVRSVIPVGSRAWEAQLDVFNVLNLLGRGWGLRREAEPALLEHVRHTQGSVGEIQPVFRFDPAAGRWTTVDESGFQLQAALRYRF